MNTTEQPPLAATDYLTTLGLQQHPYLDSSDARFFYADPSLIQRLDLLQHLTQFGDMLLSVTGPADSGKSTLAQQFLLRGNTAWRTCHLNGAQIQQSDELLAKLADGFGLQSSAPSERLKAELLRHCQALRHNAQLAVVVIDNAQQLPDPALKALLELAEDPRETLKLLRVILFSEPGLEQRLAATGWHSPQQPLLHNLDIPNFDEQQTAAYLMYRLAVAGYSGESPFSLTEIRALHKAADGSPGKLNVLAHEILMERARRIATRKVPAASGSRRTQLVMVLGLVGSLVAGGFAWYASQELTAPAPLAPLASAPPVSPATTPSVKPADATPVLPVAPAAGPKEESQKSLGATPGIQQHTDVKDNKSEKPATVTQPTTPAAMTMDDMEGTPTSDVAQLEPAPTSTLPPAVAAETPANAPSANAPASTAPAPKPDTIPAMSSPVPPPQSAATPPATPDQAKPSVTSNAAATSPAPPNATPAAKPEPTEKPPSVSVTEPEAEVMGPPTPPKPTTAASAPNPPPVPPGSGSASPDTASSEQLGTDWLQSRPGSRFTLQLLGGRSEKSLREYLKQNRIPEPVATFRTVHKGAYWYVLVHGDFESLAAARVATATLPSTVRKGKPWARSFASVHTDMQKTRP